MIVTQEIARIAQALLKDSTYSLVEARWQTLTPLNLTPGQMVQAEVMANLPDSRYLIRLANQLLRMELPLNLQPGQTVELTFVSEEPRLVFALSKEANSGVPVRISDTGRWLNQLATSRNDAAQSTPLPRPSVILQEPPRDTGRLAEGLRTALTRSGVFYESHLSQWVGGSAPGRSPPGAPGVPLAARRGHALRRQQCLSRAGKRWCLTPSERRPPGLPATGRTARCRNRCGAKACRNPATRQPAHGQPASRRRGERTLICRQPRRAAGRHASHRRCATGAGPVRCTGTLRHHGTSRRCVRHGPDAPSAASRRHHRPPGCRTAGPAAPGAGAGRDTSSGTPGAPSLRCCTGSRQTTPRPPSTGPAIAPGAGSPAGSPSRSCRPELPVRAGHHRHLPGERRTHRR